VAGRIALIDRIGSGAAGSVWRAFDRRDGRYCAAKLIHTETGGTAMLRAIREQSLRIKHPHVLTPHGWSAEDDDLVLVMDLVRGGSLETLANDYGPLPAAYVAEILAQLLAGLGHVHAEGTVHRDVKPANVLLEATGDGPPHTRLIDFGAALHPDGRRFTTTGFVVGTFGYVAPEVLEGGDPGPRQDLYGAGMVAWQLLTGAAQPEVGQRFGPPPEGVPPTLWSVVAGLCAPDPRDRPVDAVAAGEWLGGCGLVLESPARTVDGEPIEIFDQLGPLPEGWKPPGPPPRETGTERGQVPEPATQGPKPAGQGRGPADRRPGSGDLEPGSGDLGPGSGNLGPGSADRGAEPISHGPGAANPWPELTTRGPESDDQGRGRPQPPEHKASLRQPIIAVTMAALGVVGVGGVLAIRDSSDRGSVVEPSSSPSASPSSVPPIQNSLPAETRTDDRAGGPCGWQDVGTVETMADGRRIRCTFRAGGTYYWRLDG
jgi:serine/threonine-protein kinase